MTLRDYNARRIMKRYLTSATAIKSVCQMLE